MCSNRERVLLFAQQYNMSNSWWAGAKLASLFYLEIWFHQTWDMFTHVIGTALVLEHESVTTSYSCFYKEYTNRNKLQLILFRSIIEECILLRCTWIIWPFWLLTRLLSLYPFSHLFFVYLEIKICHKYLMFSSFIQYILVNSTNCYYFDTTYFRLQWSIRVWIPKNQPRL